MTRFMTACAPALFLLSALPALAGSDVEIFDPYVLETPPSAKAAGGYVMLLNSGDAADRLIAARTDVAQIMLHRSVTGDDGVTRMEHQMGGIEIPADATVMLEPGGLHLMFTQLQASLTAGDTVPVVLVFEEAGEVEIDFPVIARGAGATGHSGHGTSQGSGEDKSGHGSSDN